MSKKVYPECKSSMSYSRLKIWHCDNMECTVYIDETGDVRHKSIALADIGKKEHHGARV